MMINKGLEKRLGSRARSLFVALLRIESLRLVALAMLFVGALTASGEAFDAQWIGQREPDGASHVWFRRTFMFNERPLKAWITVMTTGNCDVYVNEWNAARGLSAVNRQPASAEAVAITLDVTTLLRKDSNTIGVWYAPSVRRADYRQISVTFFGIDREGRFFAYYSGSDWLCRQANHKLKVDGSEAQDGIGDCEEWNTSRIDVALWQPASEAEAGEWQPRLMAKADGGAERSAGVRKPKHFDAEGDAVFYEFGEPFYGFVRVTLRDCKRGEKICFGDFEYTCSGKTDEQAYPKFARFYGHGLKVHGDSHFRREQIQDLEIVEVATKNGLDLNN